MSNKNYFIYIGKGLLRGFFLTLCLLLVYSIITLYSDISTKYMSVFILIITCIGIMYGSIYATRKIQRRGWLNGIIIALLYMLIIYFVSLINGRDNIINVYSFLRVILALCVGALSGMLGINL